MAIGEQTPEGAELLGRAGLAARDLFAVDGDWVSRRARREVLRIDLAGVPAYLKRETRVDWRSRLRGWRDGFGFVSLAVREGRTLLAAAEAGVGCPRVLAFGEDGPAAYLLVRAEDDLVPLDDWLSARPREGPQVAVALARELARMHAAGFRHPDLFPKHVLVGGRDGLVRVCLLDWQRTTLRPSHAPAERIADLASLDAALPAALASDRARLRFLRNYLQGESLASLAGWAQATRSRASLAAIEPRVRRQVDASLARHRDRHNPQIGSRPGASGPRVEVSLVEFLRQCVDLPWRRFVLFRLGQQARALHEAGYALGRAGPEAWIVRLPDRTLAPRVGDLRPTTASPEALAAEDLVPLMRCRGLLGRPDRLRVLRGYCRQERTPADRDRAARRALVARLLDVREFAP